MCSSNFVFAFSYHRKTLRFDRDRKEFVFAAGADEELVQKRIIDQRVC